MMFNNIIIIIIIIFIIIHQYTTTKLQKRHQLQTIECGSKYLKETIGLSITENQLYQFLFINDTIQIIGYDYRKLIENTDQNNYKLYLNDGQMMINGLEDLITTNIIEQLMTVIQLNNGDNSDNHTQSIITSISMSIYKNGLIHIYCLKTIDQITYYIGDYNQENDYNNVKLFNGLHQYKQIMGTISYQNKGIIIYYYDKLSYYLIMMKLKKKNYNINDYQWIKLLVIDTDLNFIYQINEKPTEQEQQQILTKSFSKIFGQHTFTYGFVDDNQMFLFSNQDEKLLTFSMNIFENNYRKYHFQLQSYQDFFHCNKPLDPLVIIDDNKQTTISTSTATVSSTNDKHDDSTTETITTVKQQHPLSTTTIISTMKTSVNETQKNITTKSNDLKTTTTTTEPLIDEEYITFPIIIIITILSIMIFLLLSIGLIVCCKRKKTDKKIQSEYIYFPSYRFRSTIPLKQQQQQKVMEKIQKKSPLQKQKSPEKIHPKNLPKKQLNFDENLNQQDSLISKTSTTTTTIMTGKSIPDQSSVSPISTVVLSPDSSISKLTSTSSTSSSTSSSSSSTTTSTSTLKAIGKLFEYSLLTPATIKMMKKK